MAAPAMAHHREPDVIVDGLAGPLSLAIGKGHNVYVTQSFAGELSRVSRGKVSTVYQLPDSTTGGLGGVAYSRGNSYHIESDASGDVPTSHIVKTSKKGKRTIVSDDFWAHEIANNPDSEVSYGFVGLGQECATQLSDWEEEAGFPGLSEYTGIVESNAYQLRLNKRGDIYVADAAANAILKVDRRTGDISTVAVLPVFDITFTQDLKSSLEGMLPPGLDPLPDCLVGQDYTPESVPTDVALDQKGRLYVTTLGGAAGELVPLSRVYRIKPKSGETKVVARGLFGATGLDRSSSGHLFVAEMFGGEVSVIKPGSSKARTLFTADSPADVVLKGRSHLYATTGTFGNGALVKFHYRH